MIYVLIIFVVLGYGLNDLSKKYSHYNLNLRREYSKHILEVDEEFTIVDIIENKKLLPVTFLQISEEVPKQMIYKLNKESVQDKELTLAQNNYHETTLSVLPNQRVKRIYRASFNQRGRYLLNKTKVVVGDFLGTKSTSIDYDLSRDVIVFPKSIGINSQVKPYGSYYGDISVKRWIINDPILNIGIREYTGNEPQKNIHWASSLRLGKLMVKEFDYTTDNLVMIILNIESEKPFWASFDADKIERCISITRAVMEELEEAGVQYSFATNAQSTDITGRRGHMPFGHGITHFFEILEVLGRINYGINSTFEDILDYVLGLNERSITYIVITPKVMNEYVENLNLLSKNSSKMVLISIEEQNLKHIDKRALIHVGKENANERNS